MRPRSLVMVTGYRGLLGGTLLRTLENAVACEADVRSFDAVRRSVVEAEPAWIVHAAAITDVAHCQRNPSLSYAVNAGGTRNIVEAARRVSARLLYVSTASVFNGNRGNYRESDTPEPINVYNVTKRKGELHALEYYGSLVLRLNLIGEHPDGSRARNLIEWLLDSIRADKSINLFDDVFVNPLSNWTVASFIAAIIKADIREPILHLGSSDVVSKADLGRMAVHHFPTYGGEIRDVSVDTIADGVARPKQMWLNTSKAAHVLGPMPRCVDEIATIISRTRRAN